MPLQANRTDICQTCIHSSECAHWKNCQRQGKTILFCEEFDDKPALHVIQGTVDGAEEHRSETAKSSINFIKGRMKGLCLNCDKRAECKYPVQDGGVWHCEDYS